MTLTPLVNDEAPPTAPDAGRFWPLLREALGGSRRDLTAMPLRRAIFLLAVPMVLEMFLEATFAVVDIFWASKLGPAAVAAVGLTESMLIVVYAIAMGLAMGVGAVVARRVGEKDLAGAGRAAVQAIVLGVVLAAVVGAAAGAAAPALLAAMGADADTLATGTRFTRVMLGGCGSVVLLFLINAAFRGAGDAAITMRALWLANGINIVLGPLLVFGVGPFPRLGLSGAAIATTIGRSVGVLFQLRSLARGRGRLAVRRQQLEVSPAILKTILRISWSGIFQALIGTTSWVGLVRIVSTFGTVAMAGYTIAVRIVLFPLFLSWGMSNAAATLVGQNLGAGRPDRAEQSVWRASFYNVLFLGSVGLVFVLLGTPIVRLFTEDPGVVRTGSLGVRIISAGFLFYAYGMVLSQSFNGAGDTRTPTLINLFCFWLWEIPLAWTLARPLDAGPTGVFVAITTAFSTMAVVSIVLFRRGRWKRVKV